MTALTKRGFPRKRVRPGAPASERIALHTITDEIGCWVWVACTSGNGYGVLTIGGRRHYAHRVAYETFVGPILPGLEIDHLCRNRACCNPEHLEAVTPQTNVRRGESPGAKALRRDRCLHGHPYEEHGVVSSGRRICRLCRTTYLRLIKQIPYAEVMRRKREGIPVVDLAAHFASQESAA